MKKISLLFAALSMLIFSCQEEAEPETIFGRYVVESILADQAIDISGDGITSEDLLAEFGSMRIWPNSIFVSVYSIQEFNVGYPQVVFTIPFQAEEDPNFGFGHGSFGRRADIAADGSISLGWSLAPDFDEPTRLHQTITVEELGVLTSGEPVLELVLSQTFFDQAQKKWVDTKITYSLRREEF
ncbi:hypothetical protein GCM10009119_27780 [Algoriphagus jejuensis]|uniref:Uncharacterized protein n=1 Tax=Algoriphagus jejuensis TaxID=419934 RepID=A0ABN1N2F6_9BACT